ncbi:glycosyltransferase family 41 protein [Xylona heveae TC161]|uniref:protein O-GlcNAc transferase n=1 Tax=Xylona heveae (strain CBS 132557 / TC161) TaxID=1328760 RepID=A0A165IJY0_XYLHT|nr:glycosyltransferase family 41 protein [Xylona heveae TC161]KZF24999.1 glycosyltransferase family 41 protein [Xylona heveae TC161]
MLPSTALELRPTGFPFSQMQSHPSNYYLGSQATSPDTGMLMQPDTTSQWIRASLQAQQQQHVQPSLQADFSSNLRPVGIFNGGSENQFGAEHMLRRKTPNGTLSAAYDGTPIDWASQAHPQKHLLASVTNDGKGGAIQDSGLRAPYGSIAQPRTSHIQDRNFGISHDAFSKQFKFYPSQYSTNIDSMLNQAPGQSLQLYKPPSAHQTATGFQMPYQPGLGPTASNITGPYGPYWPDGTFVPYRPAAFRDPRYPPRVPDINLLSSPPVYPGQRHSLQDGLDYGALSYPEHCSKYRATDPTSSQLKKGENLQFDCWGDVSALRKDGSNRLSTAHLPLHKGHPGDASILMAQSALLTENLPIRAGIQSAKIESEEELLAWAHVVYRKLLAFQKATRNDISSHPSHRPSKPIYLNPPRRPGRSSVASANTFINSSKDCNHQIQSKGGFHNEPTTIHQNVSSALPHSGVDPSSQPSSSRHQINEKLPFVGNWGSKAEPPTWASFTSHTGLRGPHHGNQFGLPAGNNNAGVVGLYSASAEATTALELLTTLCRDGGWKWIDGMLLGGCLAYGLGDYTKALSWYLMIIEIEPSHVEAISNLAATLLALNRREEAEQYWLRAIKLRPSYLEAVEHLVALLCGNGRAKEAISLIEFIEQSLEVPKNDMVPDFDRIDDHFSRRSPSSSSSIFDNLDRAIFDYEDDDLQARRILEDDRPFKSTTLSSNLALPGSDNGRIIALIHAKGNMLYALGNNIAAAKAFEDAVMIAVGHRIKGIQELITRILRAVSTSSAFPSREEVNVTPNGIVLLSPEQALQTARLLFPGPGELPGLKEAPNQIAKNAAILTTSNSLLSLAKIFQDGMSSNSTSPRPSFGVRDILALYYFSLSLQPSPSTANNVGILFASVQHSVPTTRPVNMNNSQLPPIPGVVPGSGIALALSYYNYGLNLDPKHAHLYTNLGSLLKDIGQLAAAIKMYEQAVACDGTFDIALANLANAVKDQGRIGDAIGYYRRAVASNPDFAEAVCGLANALNSVCGWTGRGGILFRDGKRDRWHVDETGMLIDSVPLNAPNIGWIKRVVDIVEKQLVDGESWGRGTLSATPETLLKQLSATFDRQDALHNEQASRLGRALSRWAGQPWEGARLVRLIERAMKRIAWQWYQDRYILQRARDFSNYARPQLPPSLAVPSAPTVLPFHTFTCPLTAKQIRMISQRNALRISTSTLRAPWLPRTVYPPPAPPAPCLNVGYVSSDFNNHPLAHLMQSAFGFHDVAKVKAFCYATTASDHSVHRQQIEREAPVFHDASSWSAERLVSQIVYDGIHILVNLNGYTRGARNEIFAARPAPIQMAFMGFAGSLGAEWCDYLLADETAVPREALRPWRRNVDLDDSIVDESFGASNDDWIYSENLIMARDTFFCCDHRQSAPDARGRQLDWDEEQARRWQMRKKLFPFLPDDSIILGNFNQLYKACYASAIFFFTIWKTFVFITYGHCQIDPSTFRTWLRILARVPRAILWLLRFPDLGETNLKQTALLWAGAEVASRIIFTDVAPKHEHISRARVCDLFLDTPECNAHTTAADTLWSGTPLLTLPRYKYKMCSRMAASILKGALPKSPEGKEAARDLIARSEEDFEERAVALASGLRYATQLGHHGKGTGRLVELRKMLYESRWTSALFDTRRWVRDLEEAYQEAWRKWVAGEGGDIWL